MLAGAPHNTPAFWARYGRNASLGLALVAITFIAYESVWHAGFIWDDNLLLAENPLVHQATGWWRVWSEKSVDYVPAVSMVWWLEWQLWGGTPAPYHLVTLAIHAANGVLLWRLLRRLRIPGAWLAAALFLVHPVNVESAAWVAEQKNTMAMAFFLGTILLYLIFEDTGKSRWYGMAAASFFLALACKTAVAPLPVVLLGMAWWRRGRIAVLDLKRSALFFLEAGLGAVLALWIQRGGASMASVDQRGVAERLAGAGYDVWFYLWKIAVPTHLLSVYPKWHVNSASPLAYLPLVLIGVVFIIGWRYRATWGRELLCAFGYFILMLSPILGFFAISFMHDAWVADRWQYFAMPGPLALAAAVVASLPRPRAIWLSTAALTGCAVLTWRQARIYTNGEAFWDAFAQANKPAVEEYNRGCALETTRRDEEAMRCFRNAIERQPSFGLAYDKLGALLLQHGRVDEALPALREAADLRPDLAQPQYDLGLVFLAQGRTAEALDFLDRAARIEPNNPLFQRKMAAVLLQNGLAGDAVVYLRRVLALSSSDASAHSDLADALLLEGRPREAISQYEKALELRPDFPRAANNLAWVLATFPDDSLRDGRKALALARRLPAEGSGSAVMSATLAAACAESGQFTEAIQAIQRARQLALSQGQPSLAARFEVQERQYEKSKPFRDGSFALRVAGDSVQPEGPVGPGSRNVQPIARP